MAKNTAANIVRGGASAAVAILLPRFLTKLLNTDRFAAWCLILQIAGYASFLDFGLQTAVARFIAYALESGRQKQRDQVIVTATLLLGLCSIAALLIISVCIWQSGRLFRGVPAWLRPEFGQAAFILSVSACLLLPLSTYTGVLTGMQNNEIPAIVIGGSRIIGAISAIVAVHFTQSLPVLAVCVGVPNVLGGLIQRAIVVRLVGMPQRGWHNFYSRSVARALVRFCGGLTINTVSMLIISGLDLTVVGYYSFSAVGSYSIASALISFVSGLTYAGLNAVLAPITALHARQEHDAIRDVLFRTTRIVVTLNLLLCMLSFLGGSALLNMWVGPAYAHAALPLLQILVVAQTVRLVMAAYSMMLVSVGSPEKGIPGAICEAAVNLAVSIAGAAFFGPVGVAVGTLLGACSGLCWNLFRVLPKQTNPTLGIEDFLQQAVLPACLPCLPFLLFSLLQGLFSLRLQVLALAVCLASGVWLARRFTVQTSHA